MNNHIKYPNVLIIAPTFEERKAIIKFLPHHCHIANPSTEIYSHPFDEGYIENNGKKNLIRVITLGKAGPQVAQKEIDRVFSFWNPRYIFLVGVCGGFVNQGVSLFDFIVPTDIIGIERIKQLEEGQKPNPDFYHTSDKLRLAMKSYFDDHNPWKKHFNCHADGHLISSGILQAAKPKEKQSIAQISELWKVYGIEMEGSGVGKALRNRVESKEYEWIDLRVVMDTADTESRSGLIKDKNKLRAAELAAQFIFEFLKHFYGLEYDSWPEEWISLQNEWFNFIENEYNFLEYGGLDVTVALSATLREMYIPRSLSPIDIDNDAMKQGLFQLKRSYERKSWTVHTAFTKVLSSFTNILPELLRKPSVKTLDTEKKLFKTTASYTSSLNEGYTYLKRDFSYNKQISRIVDDPEYKKISEIYFGRIIGEKSQILVSGEAGCGKSTFLKYFALKLMDYFNKEEYSGFIPFYIQLSQLRNKGLLAFISSKIQEETGKNLSIVKKWINHLSMKGQLFLLLDGLDELTNIDDVKRVINEIKTIIAKSENTPIILTSRPDMEWLIIPHLEMFQKTELSKFSMKDEIPEYLDRWFSPQRYRKEAQNLKKTLIDFLNDEQNRYVKNLAENPLMLTVMCAIHGVRGNIPSDRTDLYKVLIRTLLDTWERKKKIEVPTLLNSKELLKLLEYIAFNLMLQEKTEISPQNREILVRKYWTQYIVEEEPDIAIEKSINTLNWRPILLIPQKNHSVFFHKSFMEFLTASYIKNLNDTSKIWNVIKNNIHNKNWTDTIIFLFLMIENHHQIDDLIQKIRVAGEDNTELEFRRNVLFLVGRIFSQVDVKHLPTKLNITDLLIENYKDKILDKNLISLYITLFALSKLRPRDVHNLLEKIKESEFEEEILNGFAQKIVKSLNGTELLIASILDFALITLDLDAVKVGFLKRILGNLRHNPDFIQTFGEIPSDITSYINRISNFGILFLIKDEFIERNLDYWVIEESAKKIGKNSQFFYLSFYRELIKEIDPKKVRSLYVSLLDDFILQFENLESLYIEDYLLSSDTEEFSSFQSFTNFPDSLQKLTISGFTIKNEIIKNLPRGLKRIRFLRGNLLEDLDLSSLLNLRELSLVNMKYKQEGQKISFLPDNIIHQTLKSLKNIQGLKKLTILMGPLESFPEVITELKTLEELNLSYNFIRQLPQSIKNLTQLKLLDLAHNNLTVIPEEIANLTKLQLINLKSNKLNHIPSWLFKINETITVMVEDNPIIG